MDTATLTPLYTMADVTKYLGVNNAAIGRYIAKGQLEAVKMGKEWRFTPEQLQAYIKSRTVSRIKRKKLTLA